ncbi:serine/threonine protein kinase [Stieleria sp. JC731]|uniref:serine/threonine protein kinase n=1 Tax=Pirellulaceae TaxID=2691357 RepID=UPI001E32B36A|nr:serine/threonine-protein kinase [Stieleria sp. JC731]MCC9599370.1 serine/threonine protein kinase [Stieleria sp. JC731]
MTHSDQPSSRGTEHGHSPIRSFRRDQDDDVFGEATIGPGSNSRSGSVSGTGAMPSTKAQSVTRRDESTMLEGQFRADLTRFETTDELGRGGWGIVQRARDQVLEREVAIKRIIGESTNEDLREQFLHEARITGRLQHPGVVPVHELGQENSGEFFYVMKLLEGETLRAQIRHAHQQWNAQAKQNRLPIDAVITPLLERFVDICNTVAYAHQQGILHRDLKPANVMIGEFGETIVLDWGLAKTIDEEPEDCGETLRHGFGMPTESNDNVSKRRSERNGVVIGTPAYMSPEQAQGRTGQLDHRSDIFSLGVILYEILSGQHPHAGLKTDEVLQRACAAEYESLKQCRPELSPSLIAIVEKAMSLLPRDRYGSALDLSEDVRHWLHGEPVSVHPGSLFERGGRWVRRHRTLATGILSSAAILLVSASVFSVIIHSAHRAEHQARKLAELANRSALKRLIEARDAADTWLLELSGTLQFYPGLESERNRLIEKAVGQYSELAAQQSFEQTMRSTEPLEKMEQGKCYLRLGDLHRLAGRGDLALENYGSAQALFQSVASDIPKEASSHAGLDVNLVSASGGTSEAENHLANDLKIELANCRIGKILSDQEIDAVNIREIDQALEPLLPKISSSSNLLPFQFKAASAKLRLDLSLAGRQTSTDANRLQHAKSAVDWATWLSKRRGTSQDLTHEINATEQLARLYEQVQAPNEAMRTWTDLAELIEQRLTEESLPSVSLLQSVAHAKIRRAKLAFALGDREAAASDYRSAIMQLNQAWQQSDSDDFYRTNLATAEFNLAKVYAGDPQQVAAARQLLLRSTKTYQELLQQRPTVEVLQRLTDANVSLAELTQGDEDEASNLDNALLGFELLDDHAGLDRQSSLQWLGIIVRRLKLSGDGHVEHNRQNLLDQAKELVDRLGSQEIPKGLQSELKALQSQSLKSD